MAGQAYTPGLLVTAHATLVRLRELPLPGKVLVQVGDRVSARTPVLSAELPGEIEIVRIASAMGLDPEAVAAGLRVKSGDQVNRGDLLCEVKTFFGLFTSRLNSSVDGVVEFFTEANGHLGIRRPPHPLTIEAYVDGEIVAIEEGKSVSVETSGAFIQGIFGVGGERLGVIEALDLLPTKIVTAEDLKHLEAKGKVLIGGLAFDKPALNWCASAGVSAVVTGSIDSETLTHYAGEEISVSVTGDEDVPFTLIITEGFGRLPISERITNLARELSGQSASVNGATQVRAGATRPEIIVPRTGSALKESAQTQRALSIGSRIRIIRVPYFGQFATVRELPVEPRAVPSGAVVRVLCAELDTGEMVIVPRSNVELI